MARKKGAKRGEEDRPVSDVAKVALPADCRLAAQAALQAELVQALASARVELDGRQVERVDSAALQQLWLFRRELVARGGQLAWQGASGVLNEAASLLGLAENLQLPAVGPA